MPGTAPVISVLLLSTALAGTPGQPDLVLVTLDTTRLDAVSCYGQPDEIRRDLEPWTPRIDALAREGIRFDRHYTHAPTTLSSHSTLLTGRDPHGHAVPRNGYPLPPGIPTLAERLAAAGWDTVAVVGSAVLEADMGLDRGFRVYDDRVPTLPDGRQEDRADGVVRRAIGHLDARPEPDRPLFLWVHFWDPHGPFSAPGEWEEHLVDPAYDGAMRREGWSRGLLVERRRARDLTPGDLDYGASLYLSEVAWTDHQLGVLLDDLERRGLLDHAVVAVTADHGQVLSERRRLAWTHGYGVSDGVMHVPLVVWSRGVPLARGAVVERQSAHDQVASGLERALGLEPTLGDGSLWEALRPGPVRDDDGWPGRPTRTVLMEATRPPGRQSEDAWNNLPLARGVRAGGWLAAGRPGGRGPSLRGRVPEPAGPVLDLLWGLVERWDAAAPPHRDPELDPDTLRALEALGYTEPDTDGGGDDTR